MRLPTPKQVAQLLEFVARDPASSYISDSCRHNRARRGQLLALRRIDVDRSTRKPSTARGSLVGVNEGKRTLVIASTECRSKGSGGCVDARDCDAIVSMDRDVGRGENNVTILGRRSAPTEHFIFPSAAVSLVNGRYKGFNLRKRHVKIYRFGTSSVFRPTEREGPIQNAKLREAGGEPAPQEGSWPTRRSTSTCSRSWLWENSDPGPSPESCHQAHGPTRGISAQSVPRGLPGPHN